MTTAGTISASLEDYLEAIFHIIEDKQAVRAKDISGRMNVSRSSVTGALHAMAERGLVNYQPYDVITLTREGEAAAKDVIKRHEGLRDFFVEILGIDFEQADEAACGMEHAMSHEILERIVQFMKFVAECPDGGAERIKKFNDYCARRNKRKR